MPDTSDARTVRTARSLHRSLRWSLPGHGRDWADLTGEQRDAWCELAAETLHAADAEPVRFRPDPTATDEHGPAGFRARCAWCARPLRWWQRHLCRRCHQAAAVPYTSAPCAQASAWDAAPDRWGPR